MKPSILVADNNKDNCEFYKRALEAHGYHVELAHSPQEARHVYMTKALHLVLMDRRLIDDEKLDRSGEALAVELAGPIPILIFTSYELEDPFDAAAKVVPGKIEYVDKNKGFLTVFAKIEQVFADHVQINRNLTLKGYTFTQMVADLEPNPSDELFSFYRGDIEHLFHTLFRLQSSLTVTHAPVENQA